MARETAERADVGFLEDKNGCAVVVDDIKLLPVGRIIAASVSHGGCGSGSPVCARYTLPRNVTMGPSIIFIILGHQGLEGQRGKTAIAGSLC